MRILSRYVLAEFRRFFFLTMSAFVLLFIIGDFIEKVDDYIEHHASAIYVIKYIFYQIPQIAFLVMPVAVLLSTLLALGMMSKNSEIVAMKASGIPLYRIAAPIFGAAVALACLVFWANETAIPFCNAKAEYIKRVKIEKKSAPPSIKQNRLWFRGPNGEIINLGLIDFHRNVPTCYGVTFYQLDSGFRLTGRIDAEKMSWQDGRWVLANGTAYKFAGGRITPEKFVSLPVDLPERPDDFKQAEKLSEEMNISELLHYIAQLRNEGYNPVKYVVDLHGKIAFTLANIIMVIVAVPFSLKTSRSGGMALGVGISVALAICYWFLYNFSISLGHAGRFPPFFAAWLANALFCAMGVYMLLQTDR